MTEQLQVGDWTQHPTERQAARAVERLKRDGWETRVVDRGHGLYRYRVEIVGRTDLEGEVDRG